MGELGIAKGSLPLTDDTSAHDESAGLGEAIALVDFGAHAHGILEAAFTCHGVGAARVNYHGPDAFALSSLQSILACLDRGGLELVGGEDGGGGAGRLGGDEGQVREPGVRRLHADVGSGDGEALGVGTGGRDILLLGGGNGHIQGRRVVTHLALHHAGEGSHGGSGRRVGRQSHWDSFFLGQMSRGQ